VVGKVVVHYRDGRVIKGYAAGVSGTLPSFFIQTLDVPSQEVEVELAHLKAVFFVKDFDGNAGYDEKKTFDAPPAPNGRRMEIAMVDGEILVGALDAYHPEGEGFFFAPADGNSNNIGCFVVASAVKRASII
jgi:Family of unknown function (DUF6982)